jgi:hypothetical protein
MNFWLFVNYYENIDKINSSNDLIFIPLSLKAKRRSIFGKQD